MFHSSGRCFLGSHWPNWSRKLKILSLALAFSSSRRAPPKTASWRPSAMARRSVGGLQPVARRSRRGVLDGAPGVDVVLHLGHLDPDAHGGGVAIPELEDLVEIPPGVDVQHREGHGARPERLLGQVQHDDGVLAPREQKRGALELGRHLPEDVDGVRLEGRQVRQAVVTRAVARRHLPCAPGTARTAGASHLARCRQLMLSRSPCVNREKSRPPPRPRRYRCPRGQDWCCPRSGSRRRPRPSGPPPASWRRWRSRRGPR